MQARFHAFRVAIPPGTVRKAAHFAAGRAPCNDPTALPPGNVPDETKEER
jgi:hypothetical protein